MVTAGKLDQRVTVQQLGTETDMYGNTVPGGWADIGTYWASVEPLRGSEAVANMAITPRQTYRIYFRRSVTLTAADRLVWGGRVLNIRECPPARRNEFRQVVAEDEGDSA